MNLTSRTAQLAQLAVWLGQTRPVAERTDTILFVLVVAVVVVGGRFCGAS